MIGASHSARWDNIGRAAWRNISTFLWTLMGVLWAEGIYPMEHVHRTVNTSTSKRVCRAKSYRHIWSFPILTDLSGWPCQTLHQVGSGGASQVWESMKAPSSRFIVALARFLISIASLIQCVCLLFSDPIIFALSQSMMCLFFLQWSDMTEFCCSAFPLSVRVNLPAVTFSHCVWWSFFLMLNGLPVSPMYVWWQVLRGISYMALHFLSCSMLSFGWTRCWRSLVCGFTAVCIFWCFISNLMFEQKKKKNYVWTIDIINLVELLGVGLSWRTHNIVQPK